MTPFVDVVEIERMLEAGQFGAPDVVRSLLSALKAEREAGGVDRMKPNWPVPKFGYGARVCVKPLDGVHARVVDLHFYGQLGAVEYDVRYFHDGRDFKVRVFEDELEIAL